MASPAGGTPSNHPQSTATIPSINTISPSKSKIQLKLRENSLKNVPSIFKIIPFRPTTVISLGSDSQFSPQPGQYNPPALSSPQQKAPPPTTYPQPQQQKSPVKDYYLKGPQDGRAIVEDLNAVNPDPVTGPSHHPHQRQHQHQERGASFMMSPSGGTGSTSSPTKMPQISPLREAAVPDLRIQVGALS